MVRVEEAYKKAIKAVENWGSDLEKIQNDIATMQNELRDEQYQDILIKTREENMLHRQKLDRQLELAQAGNIMSLALMANYYAQLQLMREKEALAAQLSDKRKFEAARKAHKESLQHDFDYVHQRLQAAKRYYREEEAFIIALEHVDKKTRASMLKDNKKYWEGIIRQLEEADTKAKQYSATLAVLGRMFGTLATLLRDMLDSLGASESKFAQFVDIIDTSAKSFRALKAAVDAYDATLKMSDEMAGSFIGKLTKISSVADLVIAGITTVISIGAKIWKLFKGKSEQEKAAEEAERLKRELEQMTKEIINTYSAFGELSESIAKKIAELRQKGTAGWLAELQLMDEIMNDIGITAQNFTMWMGKAADVLYATRDGFLGAEEGAEVFGKMFEELLKYAQEWGLEGSRALLDLIQLTRDLGIEIKQVTDYVNQELNRAASGLAAMVEWVAKPAVEAHEKIQDLLKDKKDLQREIAKIQEQMKKYGVGSQEYEDARKEVEKLQKEMDGLDRKIAKQQTTIDNVSNATKAQLRNIGVIVHGVFAAMREQGMSLFEIQEAMGDSINALRERYKILGMKVPDYLKPLFRIFKSMEKNSEFYEGLQGLQDVFAGLGNSLYLTEGMFKSLMKEAKNYWTMLTKTRDQGGMGLPEKDAIMMMYPMLQQAWWYAEQYGMKLPKWMREAIEKAESFGLQFEKPAVETQIELAEKILAENESMDMRLQNMSKNIWLMKNHILKAPWHQGGTTYSRGGMAFLHPGEAVVPENLAGAMRKFFTGSYGGGFGGGGVINATINLDGRQVYKGLLPVLREGGAYGDIEMTGDGVY